MVRVRIAPSPTGIPHIGNTRTALFNYLFAKNNNGKFILRIEDTDRARFVKESEKAIYEILKWLGIDWDEEYKQSDRLDTYKKYAEQLLKKKLAHKDKGAVRFKMPKSGETSWDDLIGKKHISFKNVHQEDFVLIKSDGFPTYNFANVVDDHLMKITHVIRGEEFISSTPKHIQLYNAFGWDIPNFAHLPIILGADKTKLSKRHGAESVLDYREKGYLKEALLNFMALLGWNPGGDRETMDIDTMVKLFDLKHVNTASPIFDVKKLEWMNGSYIRKLSKSELKYRIAQFLKINRSLSGEEISLIGRTAPLIQDRIKKLSDYLPMCEFFFKNPKAYEMDLSNAKGVLKAILKCLEKVNWKAEYIGNCFHTISDDLNITIGELSMIVRVAITGKKISPPLNESLEILGKEKVLSRLKKQV
jgi:glutamyl-tRNA synthetase